MSDLSDIIARLEKAEEGSRGLDGLLAYALGWRFNGTSDENVEEWEGLGGHWHRPGDTFMNISDKREIRDGQDVGRWDDPPKWTSSLDAALTLLPPEANTWAFDATPKGIEAFVQLNYVKEGHWSREGHHPSSPALALCIAALKAHAMVTA